MLHDKLPETNGIIFEYMNKHWSIFKHKYCYEYNWIYGSISVNDNDKCSFTDVRKN